MEYVQQKNTEKVSKFLEKGLDPNFHDPETGGESCNPYFMGWVVFQMYGLVLDQFLQLFLFFIRLIFFLNSNCVSIYTKETIFTFE